MHREALLELDEIRQIPVWFGKFRFLHLRWNETMNTQCGWVVMQTVEPRRKVLPSFKKAFSKADLGADSKRDLVGVSVLSDEEATKALKSLRIA